VPIYFDDEMKKLLKGSFSIGKINERIQSVKDEYNDMCKAVPAFADYSYDDFVWARLGTGFLFSILFVSLFSSCSLLPFCCFSCDNTDFWSARQRK
jgi:hypothetical protein